MINVFFNSAILEAEKRIIENTQVPSIVLMENAGRNAADIIADYYRKEACRGIIILCGKGNNAGDGFVAARHLANKGIESTVILLYGEAGLKGDALINYELLKNISDGNCGITNDISLLDGLDDKKYLVVDAVYGIGFKGRLDDTTASLFEKINKAAIKFVTAIDTVSGVDSYMNENSCLKADVTVSMGVKKFDTLFYEGRKLSGSIETADIGIPAELFTKYNTNKIFEIEKSDAAKGFADRDINSNKYTNGKLYILAGSEGFSGAAYLSSQSAIRTGSGAVILGLPKGLNQVMEAKTSEVITQPLESDVYLTNASIDRINKRIDWSDTVLIGPGAGRNSDTLSMFRNIVKNNDKNFVIDADGIFAFKGYTDYLKKKERKIILTPHFGEFANLTGISTDELKKDFYNIAKKFASEHNLILVLKNSPTVITDGEYFYINSTGRENLATVGSGDVLSGIIASVYSQTGGAMQSAVSGVYLHGYCGDRLFREFGSSGTIATDLIDIIPGAKQEIK
ncbi:MAG: NAD(P)H-hydrate dehydratase [Bacteroidetes bacterium]|nr:NAD(P)H-hydrate dehydratase [Bacteroidota bacterium]